ncbi:hypothetical protein MRB53_035572 [Persea americana]|uniref:Uncharacterized protein n=1 Tax=Persea americana TaxID=3435 RepID=A0ACC2K550_PERAE|nr:hypothetical protein MRB53_035572 [Persea americana]
MRVLQWWTYSITSRFLEIMGFEGYDLRYWCTREGRNREACHLTCKPSPHAEKNPVPSPSLISPFASSFLLNSIFSAFAQVSPATIWQIGSYRKRKRRLRRITGDTTWREYTKCLQRKHGITLLLGPPGCGKTTLLRALAGSLDHSLQVEGDIRYNGFGLDEFVPQKTSVYVNQYGLHIPEMTVRETLEFSAHCQGVGSRAELLMELERREQERGILPDSDLDTYRKAASVEDSAASLQTDYILKVLGLDSCLGVIVGDAMR